ncbi:outer membrane lipoprotein carrier protein LolA, partial [Pseudomonas aeruginosa]
TIIQIFDVKMNEALDAKQITIDVPPGGDVIQE